MEIFLYLQCQISQNEMKSSEFHRYIQEQGWLFVRQVGSHIVYAKEGKQIVVPFHGSKEMKKGLVAKIKKEMGL